MPGRLGPAALLIVSIVGACADRDGPVRDFVSGARWDAAAVAALPVNADPYLGALQTGFLALARDELAEFDWADGAVFLRWARRAAAGQPVALTDPEGRGLDAEQAGALTLARTELVLFLASEGALLRAGREIAEAQVAYECWLQEAEERHQTDDIARCRDRFARLLPVIREKAALPGDLAVILPGEDGAPAGLEIRNERGALTLDRPFAAAGTGANVVAVPVAEGEIREAFAESLKARPPPPRLFTLTFPSGSARIDDAALAQILRAVDEARLRANVELVVVGHADRVGPAAANRALSRRRALAVSRVLALELWDKDDVTVTIDAKGEAEPARDVPGMDAANRRVVITVR